MTSDGSAAPRTPQATPDDIGASVFTLHRGTTPLLVSMPHVGTHLPGELQERFATGWRTVVSPA